MALNDQQIQDAIIELFKILGVSLLPSELESISAMPDAEFYFHIQKGEQDGKRISIEKVRGYAGTYNASTNTPNLSNSTGTEGQYYLVNAAGSRDFGNGSVDMSINDVLKFEGGRWDVTFKAKSIASARQTVNLGDIGSADISTAFNDNNFENPLTVQTTSKGLVYVKAIQNGSSKTWIFSGQSGVYDENTLAEVDDFTILPTDYTPNGGNTTDTAQSLREDIDLKLQQSTVIAAIDAEIGNENWKTGRTLEEIQDIVGAMLQAGTHTNITVDYDDINGTINLTGTSGGTGTGLTEEEVEDIVGGLATQGTGINVFYDDAANALVVSLTGESFTTAHKNKLEATEVVTASEKSTWNGKANDVLVTNTEKGQIKPPNLTDSGSASYELLSPASGTEFTEGDTVTLIIDVDESGGNEGVRYVPVAYRENGATVFDWEEKSNNSGTEEGESLTGTSISLHPLGNTYNYALPSSATTYTVSNLGVNRFARCFINAASEPTVTGATKINTGDAFIPNTDMELCMDSPNGSIVEYYFLER